MMYVCWAVENELIPDLNKVQKRFILSRMRRFCAFRNFFSRHPLHPARRCGMLNQ